MWNQVVDMLMAVLAFASFPFLVIAGAAAILVLYDHLVHFNDHKNHGHRPAGS